jgi:hypothetical protein
MADSKETWQGIPCVVAVSATFFSIGLGPQAKRLKARPLFFFRVRSRRSVTNPA